MELAEIRIQAAKLGWSRAQAMYLADRVRNGLTPLMCDQVTKEQRQIACDGLLAMLDAIEDAAGIKTLRRKDIVELLSSRRA